MTLIYVSMSKRNDMKLYNWNAIHCQKGILGAIVKALFCELRADFIFDDLLSAKICKWVRWSCGQAFNIKEMLKKAAWRVWNINIWPFLVIQGFSFHLCLISVALPLIPNIYSGMIKDAWCKICVNSVWPKPLTVFMRSLFFTYIYLLPVKLVNSL